MLHTSKYGPEEDSSVNSRKVTAGESNHAESTSQHEKRATVALKGRRSRYGRAACGTVALLAVALFLVGLGPAFEEFRTLSVYENASDREITRTNLAHLGLSTGFYAAYWLTLGSALAVVCFVLATLIFRRKSDEPMALFVVALLAMLGASYSGSTQALDTLNPMLGWVGNLLEQLNILLLLLFFFLFPDGRFVPRWTHYVAAALVVVTVPLTLLPDSAPLLVLYMSTWLFTGVFAQIYRYRRVSSPAERQQTKWVVFGFTVALAGYVGIVALGVFFPGVEPGSVAELLVAALGSHLALLFIPVSIGIAILRYRLWDIDVIINRTLVYGALSASVVGLYALLVGGLGSLLPAGGNSVASLIAAGLVAVLFAPLRVRLQRGVNRLMYGERDEPYAVLSRLGRRLEGTLAPEAALETVAESVAQALKLPYAAIELNRDDGYKRVAEHGDPREENEVLPLVHQGETVGRLVVAPRSRGEEFSKQDRTLLEDLAWQAGAAAHAALLTTDLQRSRERLVTAREEERRRLRRDLHDGLGPTLGGLTLGLDAARTTLAEDPGTTEVLLAELKAQTREAVSDVRRLVHGLRPPALDDLGLVAAIRQQAAKHGDLSGEPAGGTQGSPARNGLTLSVDAPDHLPPLPAAVEVACYRIAQEAITNVSRHAGASSCRICLSVDEVRGALVLEVADDGVGMPEGRRAGVGMSSMRERAEELGGTLAVERNPGGGTRVLARVPLPGEEEA